MGAKPLQDMHGSEAPPGHASEQNECEPDDNRTKPKGGAQPESQLRRQGGLPTKGQWRDGAGGRAGPEPNTPRRTRSTSRGGALRHDAPSRGAESKPSREARSECQLRTQDGYEPAAHRTKSKGGAQPESQLRGQGGLSPVEKRRGSVGDHAQSRGSQSKPSREARSECQLRTQDGHEPAAHRTKSKGGAQPESQLRGQGGLPSREKEASSNKPRLRHDT